MATKFIFCLVATVTLASVRAESEFHYPGHEFDKTPLGEAIDRASMKLLHASYKAASTKNIISSPLGVLFLLAQYGAGDVEGGHLQQEILRYLGSDNYSKLSSDYQALNRRFSSVDKTKLSLANRIYVSEDYHLNDDFANLSKDSYGSEVKNIDFKNPKAAAETISKWAEEETKGNIKNAVTEDVIDSSAAVGLFNVIFFQGRWNVPFSKNNTQDRDFHVDKNTVVKKPTMHLLRSLFYHESATLGAKLIELPYQDDFRMVVVLPNEIDGLPSLLEKVEQHGLLNEIFQLQPAGQEIDLYMPKFNIDTSLNLNSLLSQVGVEKIFSVGASGIVKESPVVVDQAFQKAFVRVDEEGATAGAFTGFLSVTDSLDTIPLLPLEIKVDHPFLYIILKEDIELFVGVYIN